MQGDISVTVFDVSVIVLVQSRVGVAVKKNPPPGLIYSMYTVHV